MKTFFFILLGLAATAGFLPAKEQASESHVECFGTTCGAVVCVDYDRDLTNEERLDIYDTVGGALCE